MHSWCDSRRSERGEDDASDEHVVDGADLLESQEHTKLTMLQASSAGAGLVGERGVQGRSKYVAGG